MDKIFWIYPVWEQALDFGFEDFTPTVTSTQYNFSLRKFREYVNLANSIAKLTSSAFQSGIS